MDLFLQMGHGMKAHSLELISKWGSGTAILSPKHMNLDKLIATAEEIHEVNGSVIIDPQFYIPRTSQENLQTHSFWPNDFNTNTFFSGSGVDELIKIFLNEYVLPTKSSSFIIPTLYLSDINNDWNQITDIIVESVLKQTVTIEKYLTVCIGEEVLKNEEKTHALLEQLEDYPVDGFYIIPIHPKDEYLIDNASWLLNLLDLSAGLKLLGKKVIIGYSSHQLIALAMAKVDAISTGIWLKTRMFPLGDFDENDEENSGGRKSTWYYCPQSLSEYQIPFLDIANSAGILNDLKTPDYFDSDYSDILFSGAQPTVVNFSEREAFRHYLHCLKIQCNEVSKGSYNETKDYLKLIFDTALDLSAYFRLNGVRAKHRDFGNIGDSNLSVLDAFDNIRGLIFNSKWSSF